MDAGSRRWDDHARQSACCWRGHYDQLHSAVSRLGDGRGAWRHSDAAWTLGTFGPPTGRLRSDDGASAGDRVRRTDVRDAGNDPVPHAADGNPSGNDAADHDRCQALRRGLSDHGSADPECQYGEGGSLRDGEQKYDVHRIQARHDPVKVVALIDVTKRYAYPVYDFGSHTSVTRQE